MDKGALEINKNTPESNNMDWLKNMMFIEYGRVVRVFDVFTVKVTPEVQRSNIPVTLNVRLLNVGSSSIYEDVVKPVVGDQVLLLFMRAYDDRMMFEPSDRVNDAGDSTIINEYPASYNIFSGIGILAAPARGRAPVTRLCSKDSSGVSISEQILATVSTWYKKAVSVLFDAQVIDPGSPPADSRVSVTFGRRSPFVEEHQASVERNFGVDKNLDDEEIESPAPVMDTYGDGSPHTIRSRDKLDAEYLKASRIQVKENLSLGSTDGDVVFNGGAGYAVEFQKLSDKFDALVTAVNQALTGKQDGGGSPGTINVNISDAKVDKVRL